MNERINKLISEINWSVWRYFALRDKIKTDTKLIQNPAKAAKTIKKYCQSILEDDDVDMINHYIETIEFICYGKKYDKNDSALRTRPESIAKYIIERCDEIINRFENDEDPIVVDLNNDFKNKWLYFDYVEDGGTIIWPAEILIKDKKLVWSGLQINLDTINSGHKGPGVSLEYMENEDFCKLGYDNRDSLKDFLSKKSVKKSGTRELTTDQVKQLIEHTIYYGLDEVVNYFEVGMTDPPEIYSEPDFDKMNIF